MQRLSARFLVLNTFFAVLATAVALTAFWPIYKDPQFVVMAVMTVVVGVAIALVGALFRWPSIVLVLLVVVAYLALGVPLAIPSAPMNGLIPTAASFNDLLMATALSWKQLVTITVPVGAYQALLVPAFILILLSTVISLSLALRARRGETAVIPPLVLFVAAILLGPSFATSPYAISLGLVAVLLVWLIWFRSQRHAESIRTLSAQSGMGAVARVDRGLYGFRSVVAAAAVILIAGVAGTAATLALPSSNARQVVRTAVEQPFNPRNYPSPLSGFRAYLEHGNANKPMLTVTGVPSDRLVRIATLDTYNGVIYSVGNGSDSSTSGSFTRVPYQLSQAGVTGTNATIGVTIDGYTGPWVPGSGQLRNVTFSGANAETLDGSFFYNDTTGTAAVTTGLRQGDHYTIQSVVKPVKTSAELAGESPGSAVLPKVSVVPDGLQQTIQQYAGKAKTAGARLAAALAGLAANGYISHGLGNEPVSRSGHGADRITELLTDIPMIGDQEQYSVTAALMARELGFPARVVFGFQVPKSASLAGPITLDGKNISAWIEVETKTDGWVSVDPNPAVRPIPPKQPEAPAQISRPQTEVQTPTNDSLQQNTQAPQSHVDNTDTHALSPFLAFLFAALMIAGWVILVLAIIAAPFLAIIGAKWRRRSLRRSAPTSLERIAGGWDEFADLAVDHGYEPPPSATRNEVALVVGGKRSLLLASFADRAVFSPSAPTTQEADTVWRAVRELRKDLDAHQTRWARFTALISLRSLGLNRGRSPKQK